MNRRDALQLLAGSSLAVGMSWCGTDVAKVQQKAQDARQKAAESGQPYAPQFFSPQEWRTVRVLVDMIIPADDRSGSATDAGVPEFMDFIMIEYPEKQIWMRGGLAWLDAETRHRHQVLFADAAEAQRKGLLDDIAWPKRARASLSHGVAFFNSFRDLTASGFFSSKTGVEDLRYMGNTFVADWKGCPPEVLAKVGVTYD
ncbi:MAG: gluconate 2-dehydrogenase subunit 3 family protein [Gemmatimonadales bacterium]